jgi:8-oxo-dGTP pyrophosphatase MutT (NUDIX family)
MRFMPGVLVFPGGRVDRATMRASGSGRRNAAPAEISASPSLAGALAACAARELHEETGLTLRRLDALHYLTRAITPADRPIRFHARFLVAEARHASGAIRGSGELEEVGFFALQGLDRQPLARITTMIVEEFQAWLAAPDSRPLHRILGRDNRRPERLPQRLPRAHSPSCWKAAPSSSSISSWASMLRAAAPASRGSSGHRPGRPALRARPAHACAARP